MNAFGRHVLAAYSGLVRYSLFCEHIVDVGAVCVEGSLQRYPSDTVSTAKGQEMVQTGEEPQMTMRYSRHCEALWGWLGVEREGGNG